MTDPTEYRYTDADVRADESLLYTATNYVLNYFGEFPVLVSLKERVQGGWQLNVAQARTVLNCMRADPAVYMLPLPKPRPVLTVVAGGSDAFGRRLRSQRKKPKQRERRRLKTVWNKSHSYSVATGRSHRMHLLDQRNSYIEWTPWHEAFVVELRWLCSQMPRPKLIYSKEGFGWITKEYPNIRLITRDEALNMIDVQGYTMCPQCLHIRDRRGL